MRSTTLLYGVLAAGLLALGGCGTAPRHPALAQAAAQGTLPPVLPVRRFVANVDFEAGFALSPDGASLLFERTVGTDGGLAVRPVAGGDVRTFPTGFLARPDGATNAWLPDSRHVLFVKDLRGDENTHLHVFDSRAPFDPWEVTPWPGTRSYYVGSGAPGSTKFFFASNRRDRSTMDLYEADAASRTIREVAQSDGRVLGWMIGNDDQLAGRIRQLAPQDGADRVFEVLEPGGGWRAVRTIGGWDHYGIHRVDRERGIAWGLSNIGRDKSALVEISLVDGRETVLADHPVVDIDTVYYPRRQGAPLGYLTNAGLPQVHIRDAAFGADLERAAQRAVAVGAVDAPPLFMRPQSTTEDGQRWVLRALGDYDDAELLFDRRTGEVTRLDPKEPERRALLSPQLPYSFTTSDGRTMHGYVTRPRGVAGPAPLVVVIHGGPWARDQWSPAGFGANQLLANRGYAVLNVNYRGSWGYGREHMMAGRMESFGRMQQDIAEAAQWAVAQGLADPQRMAVLGASFGGFSVLAQLAQQRQDWRCGVDLVGVANWPRVIENWPPFWRNRHMFAAFFGDPSRPEERERMLDNSPIRHVASITAPLLVIHGANDIRVLREDSDEVVAELRKLGRPVEFLSFPNEGHSIRRWRNKLETWRRIEDTLAACLGGRTAGWDFYELVPR
jgi:dipeptidyl aminopeptidase/acylaminoacyl peptidase